MRTNCAPKFHTEMEKGLEKESIFLTDGFSYQLIKEKQN